MAIQEERSIFWEVVGHCEKKAHKHMCVILNVTEMERFESPDKTVLDFCLWGWIKK